MQTQVFVIRRAFLFPLGLLLILLISLLAVAIFKQEPFAKLIILTVLMVPVGALFLGSLSRRVVLNGEEIEARRLMGATTLRLEDITSVDVTRMKKRAFLSIDTRDNFLILTNSYRGFDRLLNSLIELAPHAASEQARVVAIRPPVKQGDIISAWIAVLAVTFVLYVQLFSWPG